MKRFLIIAATIAVLTSCKTTDIYERGQGPIVLNEKTTTGFANYKLYDKPSYFAVANDGKGYGFTHCPHSSCTSDQGERARETCNKGAGKRGTTCSTFAIGREVVWNGPVSYAGVEGDYVFTFAVMTGRSSKNWGGSGRIIEAGRKIALNLGTCKGDADLNTRKWFIKGCKNGYSAFGTFVEGQGSEKYYGIGIDSKDKNIEIRLLVPESNNTKSSVVPTKSAVKSTGSPIVSSDQTIADKDNNYTSPRSLAMEWEGRPNILIGTIRYPESKDGTFIANFPSEDLDCSGSYSFGDKTTGVWNIACGGGDAASGTFTTDPNGSTGTGTDTKGRKVKYTNRPATG